MKKYYSQYSGEELDAVLSVLDNSWIQLSISNGAPNSDVDLYEGEVKVILNKMSQWMTWTPTNATVEAGGTFVYPNYNYISVVADSSKTECKATTPVLTQQNHIYYLKCFIDGLNSNSAIHGIQLEEEDNASSNFASSFSTSLDTEYLSCRGKVTSDASTVFACYANHSNVKKTSQVFFGMMLMVDLTESFGAGQEPELDWCDNNLTFYRSGKYETSILIGTSGTSSYDVIHGSFDEEGNSLINLPGYGTWTLGSSLPSGVNSTILPVYNRVEVDEVKRYYMELPEAEQYTKNNVNLVIQYGPLVRKRFLTYLYYKNGDTLTPTTTDLTTSTTFNYYVYEMNENDNGSWKWAQYSSDTAVRSGTLSYIRNNSYDTGNFASLPSGDYRYFTVPSGWQPVE